MANFAETKALTFDLFGTILDLGGSLTPFIKESLDARDVVDVSAAEFWEQWRYRQRIEQYQDTIMMLGHSGYLETVRRALHYTLDETALMHRLIQSKSLCADGSNYLPFRRFCLHLHDFNLGIS